MDTNPLARLRADFVKSAAPYWGAVGSAVGTALVVPFLLLLLYLFVDLLVWRGEMPSYAQLTSARKRELADEWAARPDADRAEAADRLGLTGLRKKRVEAANEDAVKALAPSKAEEHLLFADEWEDRWQATVYLTLRDRIGANAAEAYLVGRETAGSEAEARPQLGLASIVVRDRNHWYGALAGQFAKTNSWTWIPNEAGSANVTYLTGLFIIALGLAAIRGILVNAVAYLSGAVVLDTVTRLRRAVYLHASRFGPLSMQTFGTDEAARLMTDRVDEAADAIHARLTAAFRHPITIVLVVLLILLVNFWLALSFLALAGLVWLIGGQIAAHFRRDARAGERRETAAVALLKESINLFRLVKRYLMERFNQARVERQLAESARASWRRLRGAAMAGPLLGSVTLIAGVALLYLAGRSLFADGLSVAGLAVLGAAVISLGPPIAGLFDFVAKNRRGREAAEALFEFLDRKGEAAEAADAEFLPVLTTRVEFRQVTLNDPATGKPLLENVTFAVPAGAKVAIVGPSPAEKRALVYLIPRFLDPNAGEVRIEDKNIRWVTHDSLRLQVAMVMQDDLTFTDTVANNIGCGDPQYNLPQIIEAAKLAHAHQFIERLPYGYETLVGPAGYTLTPGERFRIALARALLRDPSILVIEEPIGPIDEDTLALLDDTLARVWSGRTIIFLAQRLSTLQHMDRVFMLRNGNIEAQGTHGELWKKSDLYRRLQIVSDSTGMEQPALKDEE